VATYGASWSSRPDFVAFVCRLFQHSQVLAERAAVLACRQASCWERDFAARASAVKSLRRLEAEIDDDLSKALVIGMRGRTGVAAWPWVVGLLP
jgi:hypothetical protein